MNKKNKPILVNANVQSTGLRVESLDRRLEQASKGSILLLELHAAVRTGTKEDILERRSQGALSSKERSTQLAARNGGIDVLDFA